MNEAFVPKAETSTPPRQPSPQLPLSYLCSQKVAKYGETSSAFISLAESEENYLRNRPPFVVTLYTFGYLSWFQPFNDRNCLFHLIRSFVPQGWLPATVRVRHLRNHQFPLWAVVNRCRWGRLL